MKRTQASEPVWGGDRDAIAMHEQTEHWRKTFTTQIEVGLKFAADYKPGFYGRPTFVSEMRKRVRANQHTIKS